MESNGRIQLAKDLFHAGVFKDYTQSPEGHGFRLAAHDKNLSLPLSPCYFNLRTTDNPKQGPLTQTHLTQIGQQFHALTEKEQIPYMRVAGIPNAGDPLATGFLAAAGHPIPSPRQLYLKKAGDGSRTLAGGTLEGNFSPGENVLLIDDVITDATSKRQAAEVLRHGFRLTIEHCLVVVDRRGRHRSHERYEGIQIHPIFPIEELLSIYREEGYISHEVEKRILAYIAAS